MCMGSNPVKIILKMHQFNIVSWVSKWKYVGDKNYRRSVHVVMTHTVCISVGVCCNYRSGWPASALSLCDVCDATPASMISVNVSAMPMDITCILGRIIRSAWAVYNVIVKEQYRLVCYENVLFLNYPSIRMMIACFLNGHKTIDTGRLFDIGQTYAI